jgi:sialate O-acetylesterase
MSEEKTQLNSRPSTSSKSNRLSKPNTALKMKTGLLLSAALAFALPLAAQAKVTLAPVFKSHMVLQRQQRLPVWGTASPGEKITLTIANQTLATVADKNGKFKVDFEAEEAGGPYKLMVKASNTIILDDVLIGEVWFCAGQSNMVMIVKEAAGAAILAKNPSSQVRVLTLETKLSSKPEKNLNGNWTVADTKSCENFSAVAYAFAKELQTKLNIPVGLIVSSVGGSPIDAWLPTNKPAVKPLAPEPKTQAGDAPAPKQEENIALADAFADGQGAGLLFNGMVNPVIPYALKGVLFYQGEADLGNAAQYKQKFTKLIEGWRDLWNQEIDDFPFIFVQLPNCDLFSDTMGPQVWAELRDAQNWALGLRDVYGVTSIDLGEAKKIHPPRKMEVGQRAAFIALNKCYGQDLESQGPKPISFEAEGNKIHIKFENCRKGLRLAGGEVFKVAGRDRKFKPARALVDKDTVTIWNDEIKRPAEIQYAWENNPCALLYNGSGLPAGPFKHYFMPK